jgi:hypothetical protein
MEEPRTTHSNLAKAFLHVIRQACENTARKNGHWDLFLKSKEVAGFKQAEESWEKAFAEFIGRSRFKKLPSIYDSSLNAVVELFFEQLRWFPSQALQRNQSLIMLKAGEGDVQFFTRISAEIRNAKRKRSVANLSGDILGYWLHGFLWLMSDKWGSYMLERYTCRAVSEENFVKCRQRLELVSYDVVHESPLIKGFNKRTSQFVFRDGWTDLAPHLST